MTDWPEYESHKVVRAAKIVNKRLDSGGNVIAVKVALPDGTTEWFEGTVPAMTARAEIGGYAVVYPDGFRSVSPAREFEDGYTRKP